MPGAPASAGAGGARAASASVSRLPAISAAKLTQCLSSLPAEDLYSAANAFRRVAHNLKVRQSSANKLAAIAV